MAGKNDTKSGDGPSKQTGLGGGAAPGGGLGGKKDKLLNFATAIGKWQNTLTEERRMKIRQQFTVPRNDPEDPFKPNSETSVKKISEQPYKKPLKPGEESMLQTIAVSYDYCLPLDIINMAHPRGDISEECQEHLEKLPTWLKAIILLRFDKIQEHFAEKTHLFLRILANQVDLQKDIPMKIFEVDDNEDEEDYYIINKNFLIEEKDLDGPRPKDKTARHKSFRAEDLFRVAHAVALWRLPKSVRSEWAPNVVHRGVTALRRAMLTQASPAEVAMVAEDEAMSDNGESDDEEDLYKPPSWREIISERPKFKEEIQKEVDTDFETVPYEFRKLGEAVSPKIRKKQALKKKQDDLANEQRKLEKSKVSWYKRTKLFANKRKVVKKEKNNELIDRGLYRRYSRIWFKDCPRTEIGPTRKRAHHNRSDEGFHAYIVTLVGSKYFRWFIMTIIVLNALLLAVETGEETEHYTDAFEILDNFFLSVYLIEFVTKVYANPQKFWRSGFNIFEFIILIASFTKSIADWTGLVEIQILRALVIVRALRILRGVSLNIQIQVLVTAMVETLKTHVLSVLILLLLLMYITSIITFYLFGNMVKGDWGNIGKGMLNLFAFFVMDNWTEIVDHFEEVGALHVGRAFALVGIVLGNFVFANIFIAIIIMQISDATDEFRNKQSDERESLVKRKKEIVFRRQKLDMRQLLARQKISLNADFYYLASQFQRLLPHDDMVEMVDMICSPMWIDCINNASQRCLHTSNMLMNLHRTTADRLLEIFHLYNDPKPAIRPIRRARYNRCCRLKAKLTSLKSEFYENTHPAYEREKEDGTIPIRVKLPPRTKSEMQEQAERKPTLDLTSRASTGEPGFEARKSILRKASVKRKQLTALQKLKTQLRGEKQAGVGWKAADDETGTSEAEAQ